MKKLLMIGLMTASMMMTSFAADDVKIKVEGLNIDKAYEMAVENDLQVKSLEEKISIQKELETYSKAESTRVKDINEVFEKVEDEVEKGTIIYVNPITEAKKLLDYQRDLGIRKNTLRNDLFVNVKAYVSAEESLLVAEKSEAIAKKKYENSELKYELGLNSTIEVYGEKVKFLEAQKATRDAKRSVELKQLQFNHILGEDTMMYHPLLTSMSDLYTGGSTNVETFDLDKIIEEKIAKDDTILKAQEDIEVTEMKIWSEKKYRHKASVIKSYDEQIVDFKEAIEKRKKEIKFKTYEKYYNLKIAGLEIKISQNTLENSQIDVKKINSEFDMGLITELDLNATLLSLEQSKNNLNNLLRQYYIDLYVFNELQ